MSNVIVANVQHNCNGAALGLACRPVQTFCVGGVVHAVQTFCVRGVVHAVQTFVLEGSYTLCRLLISGLWCFLVYMFGHMYPVLFAVDSSSTESSLRQRSHVNEKSPSASSPLFSQSSDERKKASWKRILLLIVAVTIHNIPGLPPTVIFTCFHVS